LWCCSSCEPPAHGNRNGSRRLRRRNPPTPTRELPPKPLSQ
jgi:hypothetical protein